MARAALILPTLIVLSHSASAADPGVQWLRVPDAALSGTGISDSIDSAKALERNDTAAAIMRKVIFQGQLRTSVVQMKGDSLHLPSFPDDEVFCVIVGSVILVADETRVDQVFRPGDCGFVPKGWAGVWRQPDAGKPGAGVYREWATIPASFSFDVSLKTNPPVKGARAFAIDPPRTPGTHQLHDGTIVVEAENAARETARAIAVKGDQTILILKGNLTLPAADKSETFKPGDIAILPKGLNAEMRVSDGYRALIVRAK